MPFLASGDAEIHYEHHGAGSGRPAVLFSHAYGASMSMWRGQVDETIKTHQALLWNMRGHGRSTAETYTHQAALADIDALLDLAGGGGVILCGLSLGGYLSLMFTLAHPEKVHGLILCDTGPGFRNEAARRQWNETAERQARVLEKRGLAARPKAPGEEDHRSAAGLAAAARGILAQSDSHVIEGIAGIKIPALVMVGGEDKPFLGASDYMAKKLPQARQEVLAGAGHFANCDEPEGFNRHMRTFLDEVLARAG